MAISTNRVPRELERFVECFLQENFGELKQVVQFYERTSEESAFRVFSDVHERYIKELNDKEKYIMGLEAMLLKGEFEENESHV